MPLRPGHLTLAVEYAADVPLTIDGKLLRSPAPLDVDDDLSEALIAWQRHFDTHFSIVRWPYWDSLGAAAWHEREGHRLLDDLQAALPDTQVELSLWPLEGDNVDGPS